MPILTDERLEIEVSPDLPASGIVTRAENANDTPSPAERPVIAGLESESRWGVILAGGDGNRLRSLTRVIAGDDRPKQFCKVIGRQTLLAQARNRAARCIPAERTIVALTAAHQDFYEREPDAASSLTLVQPSNRGTAPAILLSLLHIAETAPGACVAILPSDHYYSDDAAFTASLDHAFRVAEAHPTSIVLLGAQPNGPEVDFGWIKLGTAAGEDMYHVRGFIEKPGLKVAEQLFQTGALWNTFVMVGEAMAFLWMAFVSLPELVAELQAAVPLMRAGGELHVPECLYDDIPTADFSREVLSPNYRRLLALRICHMEWHDLGHPDRVVSVLRSQMDETPAWMHQWDRMGRMNPGEGTEVMG